MRQYEVIVVSDPEADEDKVGQLVDRITKVLSEHQAEVKYVDRWGRRKLAFELDKKTEGYYFVLAFTAESPALAELDRVLSLADEVMRFKIVRTAA